MSPERTAALIIIIAVLGCVLIFAIAYVAYSFYDRYRPQVAEPLVVGFEVAIGNGDYKHTIVGVENDRVANFDLPTNSSIEFNYYVACGASARYTQNNVTLYFEDLSDGILLLDTHNQIYPIPYTNEIGGMEINTAKQFAAILETPAQAGIYQMRWHITSDQADYSFVIFIRATQI